MVVANKIHHSSYAARKKRGFSAAPGNALEILCSVWLARIPLEDYGQVLLQGLGLIMRRFLTTGVYEQSSPTGDSEQVVNFKGHQVSSLRPAAWGSPGTGALS